MINKDTWKFVRMGRLPKFKQPEDLAEVLEKYFNETSLEDITLTGIAELFGSHKSMGDYRKKEAFRDLIDYARMVVENKYEKSLCSKNTSGAIFALKNMGNWVDRVEQTQNVTLNTLPAVQIGGKELKLDIGEDPKQLEGNEDE